MKQSIFRLRHSWTARNSRPVCCVSRAANPPIRASATLIHTTKQKGSKSTYHWLHAAHYRENNQNPQGERPAQPRPQRHGQLAPCFLASRAAQLIPTPAVLSSVGHAAPKARFEIFHPQVPPTRSRFRPVTLRTPGRVRVEFRRVWTRPARFRGDSVEGRGPRAGCWSCGSGRRSPLRNGGLLRCSVTRGPACVAYIG